MRDILDHLFPGLKILPVLVGLMLFQNYQEYQRLKGPPPSIYGY